MKTFWGRLDGVGRNRISMRGRWGGMNDSRNRVSEFRRSHR